MSFARYLEVALDPIGAELKAIAKKKGLSVATIAGLCNLTRPSVYAVYAGRASVNATEKVADVLGHSIKIKISVDLEGKLAMCKRGAPSMCATGGGQ